MASNPDGPAFNPADQVAQSWRTVSEALKTAGQQATERNKELGMCVIKQAEKNASQLFDTLQAMAKARNPAEIYQLYTRYLTDSVSVHSEQLKEVTDLLAKSGQGAWEPITSAIQQATGARPKV